MKFGARAAEYRAAPTSPSKADAADARSLKGGVNGLMDLAGMAKPAQALGYPKELSAGTYERLGLWFQPAVGPPPCGPYPAALLWPRGSTATT
jgi:hypothetical protein